MHGVGAAELGGRALGEANILNLACKKYVKSALFRCNFGTLNQFKYPHAQPTAPS
jgi:hypothetical protein